MQPHGMERAALDLGSRLGFSWDADSVDLTAWTGEAGVLTRAATGTALDDAGTSRTLVNDQPRWQWEDYNSDGIREQPTLLLGQASGTELLAWPWRPSPVLNMTGLVEFTEGGAIGVASAGVWYLGNDAVTGARLYIDSTGSQYRITHHNGTSSVTATMTGTAPTTGQRVQLRWGYTSTGRVQIWQSINGGAETTPGFSGTLTPAASWGAGGTLYHRLGSVGSANRGLNGFKSDRVIMAASIALSDLLALR